MHFILGLLGTIVTILILLNRLADAGIDLGGLNPFLWHRRRKWRKMSGGKSPLSYFGPHGCDSHLDGCCCEGGWRYDKRR